MSTVVGQENEKNVGVESSTVEDFQRSSKKPLLDKDFRDKNSGENKIYPYRNRQICNVMKNSNAEVF